jgi:ankyrin repeat protein
MVRTNLHLACCSGDLTRAIVSLEVDKLNINEKDKHGITPLHVAARFRLHLHPYASGLATRR